MKIPKIFETTTTYSKDIEVILRSFPDPEKKHHVSRCDPGSLVTMKFTPSMCMCVSGKAQAGKGKNTIVLGQILEYFLNLNFSVILEGWIWY